MLVLARIAPLFLLAPLFSSQDASRARAHGRRAVALAVGIAPIAAHGAGDGRIPTGRARARRR